MNTSQEHALDDDSIALRAPQAQPQAVAHATAARSRSRTLSGDELERFGAEIDALRARTVADLGERDARYIRGILKAVRFTELGGRVLLMSGLLLSGVWMWAVWALGVALLAVSKILDNMELGHNVIH
ncbi:MAG TPA: hypothetical protein VFH49_12310, partial [Aquabacterium sp.]|nr:hypothetical protein [Aquabacterium sp.]